MKTELQYRIEACAIAGELLTLEAQEQLLLLGLAALRMEKGRKLQAYARADAAADKVRTTAFYR